jgi:hypothetical protein
MFFNDDPTGRRAFVSALVLVVMGAATLGVAATVPYARLSAHAGCHQVEYAKHKECIMTYLTYQARAAEERRQP